MKKIILAFACMLGFVTANFAQNTTPAKDDVATVRAKNLDQIVAACKQVGLDDQKIAKAKAIIENLYKKQDDINGDSSLSADEKKQKLKDANADKDWRMKNLMGDKYKEYSEARKKMIADAAAKPQ
jgi:hypothetical protein